MINMSDWSKTNESFEVLVNIFVKCICYEPLGSPLGVAEVDHFCGISLSQDIAKIGGNIILTHFIVGEVPESFIIYGKIHMRI